MFLSLVTFFFGFKLDMCDGSETVAAPLWLLFIWSVFPTLYFHPVCAFDSEVYPL